MRYKSSLISESLILFLFFASFTALTANIFSPYINSNADTKTASQTFGPHAISISTNDAVAINITPTSEQAIYSGNNIINITNSCADGATITLSTNSNSDTIQANNLIRSGSDDSEKIITPTTGNSLIDNSWGYSIDNGVTFHAVPAKDQELATIYNSSSATTDPETLNLKYGIKISNNTPSGNYSNDVVYTVAVKPACISYSLSWDLDGGTGKTGANYSDAQVTYGDTINFNDYTPTKDGFTFAGWTSTGANGTANFTGEETDSDPNPYNNNSITIKAVWVKNTPITFSYTGAAQTWTVPANGRYKIELWGAQGGWHTGGMGVSSGGKGGYVSGVINLKKAESLYAYVGGYGYNGGWNGGGATNGGTTGSDRTGNGGGATDIRVTGGAWNNADSLRSRIIVAGGGGAGAEWTSNGGGDAGGLTGLDGLTPGTNCSNYNYPVVTPAKGGNQIAGGAGLVCNGICMHTASNNGAFGIGAADAVKSAGTSPSIYGSGGGGGGWYGGGSGATTNCHIMGSAGGSSYISGYTGAVGITSTTSSTPKSGCTTGTTNTSCSLTPYINPATNENYTFANMQMSAGNATMPNTAGTGNETGHTGNGYIKITYLGN